MVIATITSKGQITIPKSVRNSLNLHTGDLVAFSVHGPSEVVMTPVTKSVDEVFGLLHKPDRKIRTVEEMNAAIKARMRKGT